MFQKGDFVTYGSKGVCEISAVTTLQLEGIPKDRLYYEMRRVTDVRAKVFTPVENEGGKSVLRPVLSEEEATALLERIPQLAHPWIRDDRTREEAYREIINSCDADGMLAMIKALYHFRRERALLGRKLPAMDSKYLRTAQENLFAELALALQLTAKEVEQFVTEKILSVDGMIRNA